MENGKRKMENESFESAERFLGDPYPRTRWPSYKGPPKAEDFFCLRFEPDRLGC